MVFRVFQNLTIFVLPKNSVPFASVLWILGFWMDNALTHWLQEHFAKMHFLDISEIFWLDIYLDCSNLLKKAFST